MELYNRYRPKNLSKVVGNDKTIAILQKFAEKKATDRPHTFLFTGGAGCGKTTLAHIMADMFGCKGDNLEEFNSASYRGIDSVREIQQKMQRSPTGDSTCRCFVLEEVHQLSKDAQEALLKPTENCPNHVYFMLTTTNPEKLTTALTSRASVINVASLTEEDLIAIMQRVVKLEKDSVDVKVLQKIADISAGSARVALTMLEKILALPVKERSSWEEAIASTSSQAIDLCRCLMKRPKWAEIVAILKGITDDPETVRRMVLGYANSVLLGGRLEGYNIILCFEENYYSSGKAGLTKSCYEYLFGTEALK